MNNQQSQTSVLRQFKQQRRRSIEKRRNASYQSQRRTEQEKKLQRRKQHKNFTRNQQSIKEKERRIEQEQYFLEQRQRQAEKEAYEQAISNEENLEIERNKRRKSQHAIVKELVIARLNNISNKQSKSKCSVMGGKKRRSYKLKKTRKRYR